MEKEIDYKAVPLYRHSAEYAIEHGELALYRESHRANKACSAEIEKTIYENYKDNRLDTKNNSVQLGQNFTMERVAYVLANTIQIKSHDGRISDAKAHIHNHIVWNSTTLDATRKFKDFRRSGMAVRKLSDLICIEHQLSVVENPQKHGKSYDVWLGKENEQSFRDRLRIAIDQAMRNKPKTIDELIKLLEQAGYDVKRGKYISCKLENQKKYIRLRSLGEGYSEAELLAVMKNEKPHEPFVKRKYPKREQKTTLLSQLETKINSGKGVSYDQALKVIKVKQMAKSIAFIQERGFRSIEELSKATADSENLFNEQRAQIKKLEARMEEVSILRTHILNYMKTKATFDAYKKSGYSKKFLEEHEGEIVLHRASKKAFNQLDLKKLPTIKSLNDEFATLSAQKKAVYDAYRKTKSERKELMTHKANVEFILGLDETNLSEREYQHE